MFRYSIRTLLALVLIAAVICAVMFAFPLWLRVLVLFVGVLAMPGPLVVMLRGGGPAAKSSALGGLVAYAVWLACIGFPAGFEKSANFGQFWSEITFGGFGGGFGGGGFAGGG